MSKEKEFIAAVVGFAGIQQEMAEKVQSLTNWRLDLEKLLESRVQGGDAVRGEVHQRISRLEQQVQTAVGGWSKQWEESDLLKQFSDTMSDRMVLLVFGKVNAGKSSFCNFLARRFAAYGHAVQYFSLENGQRVLRDAPFKEGATETTACIQGVELGDQLVLLDTPGLHSVTEENGDLTRRYLDAADAVLWLTSSAAPGQVQELQQLREELGLGKPLQAVITRSDRQELDENADGELVSTLFNKTPENRRLQEQDVHKRASEYLQQACMNTGLLRAPISVSAHCAEGAAGQPDELEKSGFEELFGALLKLADQARTYKSTKPLQMASNFIQKKVKAPLEADLLPSCREAASSMRALAQSFRARVGQVSTTVELEVMSALPALLDEFRVAKDKAGLLKAVDARVGLSLSNHLTAVLEEHLSKPGCISFKLGAQGIADFKDEFVELHVKEGAGKKSLSRVIGSMLGGLAGLALGGLGGVAGAALGERAGNALGERLESTRTEQRLVGTSYAELLASLGAELKKRIPSLVAERMNAAAATLDDLAGKFSLRVELVETRIAALTTLGK